MDKIKVKSFIESEKTTWLAPGNLNNVMIDDDTGSGINYPYGISCIEYGEDVYVAVVNVINALKQFSGIVFDPQAKVSVYEIINLDSDNPSSQRIFSETTLRCMQEPKTLYLKVKKEEGILKLEESPSLNLEEGKLKLSYTLFDGKDKVVKDYIIFGRW